MIKFCSILFFLLFLVIPLSAQQDYFVLLNFEGEITILQNLESIRIKKGLVLNPNDIIDAHNGAAVVSCNNGAYYALYKEFSTTINKANDYRTLNSLQIKQIEDTESSLEVIFKTGTPIPGFQTTYRKKNVNLILILDISTSMIPFFEEIKTYIKDAVIENSLINQDYLYFYTFGEYITNKIDQKLDLLASTQLIHALIDSIWANEEATDIGLALEALDKKLEASLPYDKSIIFFITDGKNDPLQWSPYYGLDIYSSDAFNAFETVKNGKYKVLLLSIGKETAAKDLSGPLGGEYIEVSANLTSEGLSGLIGDLTGDLELITAGSLGKISKKNAEVKLGFLSSYVLEKELHLNTIYYSIDNGKKIELTDYTSVFKIPANKQIITSLLIPLPDEIKKGDHTIQLEIISGNMSITGTLQEVTFRFTPVNITLILTLILGILLLAAALFFIIRKVK